MFLLLIPPQVLLYPVKKLSMGWGLAGCLAAQVAWYCIGHWALLPESIGTSFVAQYSWTELRNLIGILPAVYAGAFLCKGKAVARLGAWANAHCPAKWQKVGLLIALLALFLGFNLIHKAVLVGITAVVVFLLFNMWEKSPGTQKVFLFLGKHSTNIWLTHMFFYLCLFEGLAQKARYPLPMLLFLLALCVAASYVIQAIDWGIRKGIRKLTA